MTLTVTFSVLIWLIMLAIFYLPLKRRREGPFSLLGFIVMSVGMFSFIVATGALIKVGRGQDMDGHFAREQSCEAVVKETAMVTSASMAIGTTGAILFIAVTPGVAPLVIVALAVGGGSIAGIGGYGAGVAVASSFSPHCQAPDT